MRSLFVLTASAAASFALAACGVSTESTDSTKQAATATAGTYMGCDTDTTTRDLPYQAYANISTATDQACVTACASAGYLYAGAQNGNQCFCGNSYGSHGTSSNCTMACSGNSSETCGGAWANSVYATGVSYVGCYGDGTTRDLPHQAYSGSSTASVQACVSACAAAGYSYAGSQDGNQCFCGNSYGSYGTASGCTMACSGSSGETCGGPWANSVYATVANPNPQQLNAATAAFSILRAAAVACQNNETGSIGGPCWGDAILASQRYSISGSGASATIIFNPNDVLYQYVPNAAKAALQIAQLDPGTAQFLVQGLQWDQANTNGQYAPVILPTEALSGFPFSSSPSSAITVADGNAGNSRRTEVVSVLSQNGMEDIHFVDTSSEESGFAPLNVIPITQMSEPSGNFPGYTGSNSYPSTPFNGPGNSNPYLVMAITMNGTTTVVDWNTPASSWPTESCTNGPGCTATIDIDPIPYTQSAAYYNATGLVGPQANPFTLVTSNEFADPSKQNNWATTVSGGVSHGGQFSLAYTSWGITTYEYVQQY